jgi:RNA polymerase sigma factor (sigma-70 family)
MSKSDVKIVNLQELVVQVQAGDRAAEDKLVRVILARFHNLARRMLKDFPVVRDLEQTGDIVQDSLLRLLRALRTVTPETTRDLFNLAAEQIRRQLLDLARRHRRFQTVPLEITSESSGDDKLPADCAPAEIDLDRWAHFHAAVELLPPEQREVIGLTYYHGWSQVQIADLFQVDERTIRRRWKAACLALNQALGGQIPGS